MPVKSENPSGWPEKRGRGDRGTKELKNVKILTLRGDTLPALSSLEVEGVTDSVSPPRDLSFLRILSGSVHLLTFREH